MLSATCTHPSALRATPFLQKGVLGFTRAPKETFVTDHATMKRRAAAQRSNPTRAERTLWLRLRMRNVRSVRFLRQRVIGPFIVDFYAPSLRLAIELDGGQHYQPHAQRYDEHRTAWLRARKITVLRYTNLEIAHNLDDVLSDIERAVATLQPASAQVRAHPPGAPHRPPSCGRG